MYDDYPRDGGQYTSSEGIGGYRRGYSHGETGSYKRDWFGNEVFIPDEKPKTDACSSKPYSGYDLYEETLDIGRAAFRRELDKMNSERPNHSNRKGIAGSIGAGLMLGALLASYDKNKKDTRKEG